MIPDLSLSILFAGGLRLCDLAGSERLDRSETLNDSTRLRETVNINKSLSCLADVFTALSNKQQHVPYRNSKLTRLLQVRLLSLSLIHTHTLVGLFLCDRFL
jgi:hypothetical protein